MGADDAANDAPPLYKVHARVAVLLRTASKVTFSPNRLKSKSLAWTTTTTIKFVLFRVVTGRGFQTDGIGTISVSSLCIFILFNLCNVITISMKLFHKIAYLITAMINQKFRDAIHLSEMVREKFPRCSLNSLF